ncbi:NAD(P)H-binding protein [Roseobacteraceae bacterium S113]
MRVLVLGATGTAGQGTVRALAAQGHDVVCAIRPETLAAGMPDGLPDGVTLRACDPTNAAELEHAGFCGEAFDAVVSCLASRTGTPRDAWAIDHAAHSKALEIARAHGVWHFVYLSAICVQRPTLAFQQAKLAFEAELQASGLTYAIVRPTAFFKSLSGQVDRLRAGKPFLVFGDGAVTACKPISDDDLGRFIAECLTDNTRFDKILPIGGPGPAITPLEQGAMLFEALDITPAYRHVPLRLLDRIIGGLAVAGRFSTRAADKAELARIGRYYASESMLVYDHEHGRYAPDQTPEYGTETLSDHYRAMANGHRQTALREHAVFGRKPTRA